MRAAALVLLVPLVVLAAPVPKETNEQKLAKFGTPVDPNKDCEFAVAGTKLTIKVGKGDHALTTVGNRTGAPRTLRTVEGGLHRRGHRDRGRAAERGATGDEGARADVPQPGAAVLGR